jgi:hypothetical protein
MLALRLVSLFNQFYAVYQVFPAAPLPGQQELSRATNFSTFKKEWHISLSQRIREGMKKESKYLQKSTLGTRNRTTSNL